MKPRSAAIQGTLAGLGLLAAYATWQREPDRALGEVMVLDAKKSALERVRYEEGPKWVELSRDPKDDETVWLKVAAKDKLPERELRGNDAAQKLFDRFAPLYASRALGQLKPDKLKEFGLDAPKKKLEVTVRGQKHTYEIGSSPFGVSNPYVKDSGDGRVYVLSGSILSDLDSASVRLVDRTLHAFKPTELDELTVSQGNKKRELTQVVELPSTTKILGKKSQKPDALAKNWHEKVWRVLVSDVLGKGETPAGGAPTVALRIDYALKGKSIGFLELGRVAAAAPAASTQPLPPASEIYGRSEHTAGWVKVGQNTEDLIKEAEKIVSSSE